MNPSKGTSLSEICAVKSNTLGGVDNSLLDDLQSKSLLGSGEDTDQGSWKDALSPDHYPDIGINDPSVPSQYNGMGDRSKGFGCKSFFCINVNFVMYSESLLGGGKNNSIQSILEQNYKIVTRFAGSSFIQAKHTNNFFQLLLKNLRLPDMSHIGVVTTSLPAPILNLPGNKTPR